VLPTASQAKCQRWSICPLHTKVGRLLRQDGFAKQPIQAVEMGDPEVPV
jgi:hypothetical protein